MLLQTSPLSQQQQEGLWRRWMKSWCVFKWGRLRGTYQTSRWARWSTYMAATGLLLVTALHVAHRFLCRKEPDHLELPSFEDEPRDESVVSTELPQATSVEDVEGRPKATISPTQRVIITDMDLRKLQHLLDEKPDPLGAWKVETRLKERTFSYILKTRRPKDGGPTQYLSTSTYKDCSSTEKLKDFLLDDDYRREWDDKFLGSEVVQGDDTGIEIFRMKKNIPYLGERVYMLAHKVWKGEDQTFFCFTKACRDPKNLNSTVNYVQKYLSGWRIRKIHESNGCELKLWHQEEFGKVASFVAQHLDIKGEAEKYAKLTEQSFRRYVTSGRELQKKIPICETSLH